MPYPFKLFAVGLHEFAHAFASLLTCANIESVQIVPDERGAMRTRWRIR